MAQRQKPLAPKYPPELQTPYAPAEPRAPGLTAGPEYIEARRKDTDLVFERLHSLAKFHDAVEADGQIQWDHLAIRLAQAHVPGLRPRRSKGPGRPKDLAAKYMIYLQVLQEMHEGDDLTVASACRQLSKRPSGTSRTAETIEARFHEAKSHIVASMQADQIEFDSKTGYPISFPSDGPIEIMIAFDRFRVRYCNMHSAFS